MFNIFEDIAETESKPSQSKDGFTYSQRGERLEALAIDESGPFSFLSRISLGQSIPVMLGLAIGYAIFLKLPSAFPAVLIAAILSLYRR